MQFLSNVQLAPYTTFKIGGPAKFFCAVKAAEELAAAVQFAADNNLKMFILAGGSNILVADEGFGGLAIKMELAGRKIVKEDKESVWLDVAAGENWDSTVEFAGKHGWWGVENLSHIPGTCGAIAVQNVGAYGQEASQVVESVRVFDTADGSQKTFQNRECKFGYRSSIFNTRDRGRYVILSLVMKLDKVPAPELSYRDLKKYFSGKVPTLADIRGFVTAIRDKKFPFPTEAKNGNAGSFFKNLILSQEFYEQVRATIENNMGESAVVALEQKKITVGQTVKIPAAFLLDICGLKGVSNGNVKINAHQPLVIVNATGKAAAAEVLETAGMVLKTVKVNTGLSLTVEPELIGFSPQQLAGYGII